MKHALPLSLWSALRRCSPVLGLLAGSLCEAASAPTEAPAAPAAASLPASPPPVNLAKAGEACETSVTDSLRELRGRDAQHIEFQSGRRVVTPSATQGDETAVKGAGRYGAGGNATVPFTYTCTYDAKAAKANGVVISDKGAPRQTPPQQDPNWQPDLSRLSPDACEAAVAAALKAKYPRVGRIAFGSDSRQLKPAPNARTSLEGQGGVQPAIGMNAVPFTYHCEFDNRSGKLVGAKALE